MLSGSVRARCLRIRIRQSILFDDHIGKFVIAETIVLALEAESSRDAVMERPVAHAKRSIFPFRVGCERSTWRRPIVADADGRSLCWR